MRSSFARARLALAVPCLVFGLAGCSLFGGGDKPRLEGKRIPVMLISRTLQADPQLARVPVTVAPPRVNASWTQVNGAPTHASYHLALGETLRRAFRTGTGRGSTDRRKLLAQPVVDEKGRVYVLDANARLYVIDGKDGDRLWRRDLRPKDEREGTLGGGLAYADGRIYVTTGFAQVLALNADTGKLVWRQKLTAPFRSAPTIAEGKLFAVSIDNQTHALDLKTGKIIWAHRGTAEMAALLGGASPAVEAGIVVVAYSSGELFGLGATNGRELWSEFLALPRRTSAVSTIAAIRASPVIDRGRVFAVSNSGRLVSLSLTTGVRVWEKRIAAIQSPWAAGPFLYLVTTDNLLVCLSRRDGRVRWVRSVPRYEDPKRRKGLIVWSGPVLAGDRLLLAGSNGEVLSVSPYSGDLLGRIELPDPIDIAPVVARNTAYFLTEDADLIAWR